MKNKGLLLLSVAALTATTGCGAMHHGHHGGQGRALRAVHTAQATALANPGDLAAWVALGDAYARADMNEEARQAYAMVLANDAENAGALAGMENLGASGGISEAESLVLGDPTNDELWGDLGDYYVSMSLNEKAIAAYTHAFTLDPSDGEWHGALNNLGAGAVMLAHYEEQAAHHQEDDEWLGDYGDILMNLGRTEEACAQYNTALALDPADGEWQRKVAECNGEEYVYEGGHEGGVAVGVTPEAGNEPTYGTLELAQGFARNEARMDVVAGGGDVVGVAGCNGHIQASAPDAVANYAGNGELPLSVYVTSSEDTTLLVRLPDGSFQCADDVQGTNPAVQINNAAAGRYEIWVGTYNAGAYQDANLFLSEAPEIDWSVQK